ncbi:SMODS domain-containing nucleotidyltransferase [Gilliamella sp. Fer4-1]|uniref:SMODS domain-containing nucleotidyltransferase n=1 Tax=Gilliamella sp. Fer4-1 TaxID=3120242 RepID=UPI00080EBF0B|nr:nucleotidyltransferase [Gilliamella apicola]OCG65838.1 nucleotidyltransferase [Gilliamella apicola]
MSVTDMFKEFLANLKIDNSEQITSRYEEITCCLNKKYRCSDAKTSNRLQIGSYGRWTAIKGISDLDMLYIMPNSKWYDYQNSGGQSKLLKEIKDVIQRRYPTTEVKVDRLVVTVTFNNFYIEVQPVFELDDGNFQYPDTYDGGSWKITKPREEISAMKEFVDNKNNNLRCLCKMVRAWKNNHGIAMGGLLIDTLAYNFLNSNTYYDDKSFSYYNHLSKDFFEFLKDQGDQDYYLALGSRQQVKVKKKFQQAAKKAYEMCLDAIDSGGNDIAYDKWRKIYGSAFPCRPKQLSESRAQLSYNFSNTEEFIEDKYPIDIRYSFKLDCIVTQNGFRPFRLSSHTRRLSVNKRLNFVASDIDVPEPYIIKWKILNIGQEAERRDCIRGQILNDNGNKEKIESTSFTGDHLVECYVIKNNIVVAKENIIVPIE